MQQLHVPVFMNSSHVIHSVDTDGSYYEYRKADIQYFSYSYCRLGNWSAAPSNHKLVPSGAGFLCMNCGMDEQGEEIQSWPSILKMGVYIDQIGDKIRTILAGQLVGSSSYHMLVP